MTAQNRRLGKTLWNIADLLRGAMNADDFSSSGPGEPQIRFIAAHTGFWGAWTGPRSERSVGRCEEIQISHLQKAGPGKAEPAGMGREPMRAKDISKAKDPDLRASVSAMRRAANLARKIAIQTNTSIVVVSGGKLIRNHARVLRAATAARGGKKK